MFHQCTNIYNKIITLMNICQSWVFMPPNSPFFVKDILYVWRNLVGNIIFSITSLTSFLCYSINNHERALIFLSSPLLLEWIALCIAWLASMPLQILTIFSLFLLPSKVLHKVYVTFFSMCILSNKWTISRCS